MKKPKILYVDDEIENLQSFRFLFRRDFEITISQSPKEGLEILKEENFDVILSDSRMPVINGIEFLTKAQEIQSSVSRILVTGYTDYELVLRAINEAGISKCIQKPYESDQMRKVLFECSLKTRMDSFISNSESLVVMLLNDKEEIHFVNKTMQTLMQEQGLNLIGKNFYECFSKVNNLSNEVNNTKWLYSSLNLEINFYLFFESFDYDLKNKKILYGYYKK